MDVREQPLPGDKQCTPKNFDPTLFWKDPQVDVRGVAKTIPSETPDHDNAPHAALGS